LTEKVRTPYPTVKMGYAHYWEHSNDYYEKAMEDVKELGRIYLTHKPFKMIDRYNNKERAVWGDDWNDKPAVHNCGSPYGGDVVTVDAGDLVIVIKPTDSDKALNEIYKLLFRLSPTTARGVET